MIYTPRHTLSVMALPGFLEKHLSSSSPISTPGLHKTSGRRKRKTLLGLMKLSPPLAQEIGSLEPQPPMPHQVWTGHKAGFPRHTREQSGSHFLLLTGSSFLLPSSTVRTCVKTMRGAADLSGSQLGFEVCFLWARPRCSRMPRKGL